MPTKIVDLSLPIENEGLWAPKWARAKVKYNNHKFGRKTIRLLFGIKKKHLRTGLGWASEIISLSTHGATHVDAPWHYAPTSDSKPAKTIDEVPLEWCHGPGVVLDIRHLHVNAAATVDDAAEALDKTDHCLQAGDIVLIRTGNDEYFGTREYFARGPGVSAEATRWLIDKGIRMMGIDAWGWDSPLIEQARVATQTGRRDVFWAAHFVGVEREYCQIERLTNLGALPSTGFIVSAFPLKIKGGSAGLSRVVAILEGD